MLYHLLYPLHSEVSFLNVTQYITFRTAAASITAFLFSIILGPCVIRLLGRLQVGQVVRNDGPKTHETKAGTPTMGGLLILGAAIVPTLLWVDLRKRAEGDQSVPYCGDRVRAVQPDDAEAALSDVADE
jgi:phospho-N-acetylmuramoyl-pentapeptide-transferase